MRLGVAQGPNAHDKAMSATLTATPSPPVPASPWRRALRKLLRRRAAMIGLVVVLGFVVLALAAPWLVSRVRRIPELHPRR